jgi:hypothetical protein
METLKKAESELEIKWQEYQKQRNLVDELKDAELKPKSVKKYEGKYFKEKNGDGLGNSWFIYYFVKKVTSTKYGEAISLQIEAYDRLEIAKEQDLPLSMCTNEIAKEDFLNALANFEHYIADTLNICR